MVAPGHGTTDCGAGGAGGAEGVKENGKGLQEFSGSELISLRRH